jgi:hypothetical protein
VRCGPGGGRSIAGVVVELAIGVALVVAGLLAHWERRRVDRLGIALSQSAGVDPASGLYEGEAALERMRMQLLVASRLNRTLHLARTTTASNADARAIEVAGMVPAGAVAVRPTPDSLAMASISPLGEPVDKTWTMRSVSPSDARHNVDRVLRWVSGGAGL